MRLFACVAVVVAAVASTSAFSSAEASAQSMPVLEPDTRIRVHAPEIARWPIVGVLGSMDAERLEVVPSPGALPIEVPLGSVRRLDLGEPRSPAQAARRGMVRTGLLGAGIGAVAGWVSFDDTPRFAKFFEARPSQTLGFTIAGGVIGAAVGAANGAAAPGERWKPLWTRDPGVGAERRDSESRAAKAGRPSS